MKCLIVMLWLLSLFSSFAGCANEKSPTVSRVNHESTVGKKMPGTPLKVAAPV